jgi:hypothetical protein
MRRMLAAAAFPLALSGCITERQTDPPRTATEELLISTAADRAAEELVRTMPSQSRLFLDTGYFEATDGKYAIATIRDGLLRRGDLLVDKKEEADVVVEVRAGALSIDDHETLIGIPSINVPMPLTGTLTTPKIALYDKTTRLGVAKFAATGINARTGALVASSAPQYGYAHKARHIVLLFFGWGNDDLIPKPHRDPDFE